MRKIVIFALVMHSFTSMAVAFDVFPICNDSAYQGSPRISGNNVVWFDRRDGDNVYGYDLSTKAEFFIGGSPASGGNESILAISGNTVVWGDDRNDGAIKDFDVFGYDLSTNTEFPVVTGSSVDLMVDVDNDTVAWSRYLNSNVGYDIYGKKLSTGEQFPITTEVGSTQAYPTISGNIVVWQDWRNASGIHELGDLYGLNMDTGDEFIVSTASGFQHHQNINGDIIVWEDTRNGSSAIYGYDLSTSGEFLISTNGIFPDIDGDIVAWIDGDSIWGKNLLSGPAFEIATGYAGSTELSLSGNTVVWESNGDIYGATIPEPGTISLLAFGAMAMIRKRKA